MILTKLSFRWLVLVTFSVFLDSSSRAADALALVAIEKQFEARAFSAAVRLEKLEAKLKAMNEDKFRSKEGRKLLSEIAIESAYAAHIALKEKMQKAIKNTSGEEARLFHLTLNGGGAGLFDIVYHYSSEGQLKATFINELPKNWTIIFTPIGDSSLVIETATKDRLMFSLRDPFETAVLEPGATKASK